MKSQLPILLVAASIIGTLAGGGTTCYSCQNYMVDSDDYDPGCAAPDYDGMTDTDDWYEGCYVGINDDGTMGRWGDFIGESAPCEYDLWGNYECHCKGNLCNMGLCDECSNPTPRTYPPEPTTQPPTVLRCYSCHDCPKVDENTHIINGSDYNTCSLTLIKSTGSIIRGASSSDQEAGDCIDNGGVETCYCAEDLCNGAPLKNILSEMTDEQV
ncbi:unnamed protein product [Meganyctiphanes norvegica]|uniref:Protein sleepless n=1 Tax=Meganyctiphanes norvegica TaxID=48144 RepID=A0AAV2QRQ6_MEGNR